MKILELTQEDGDKVYVNADMVAIIERRKVYGMMDVAPQLKTAIVFSEGCSLWVQEEPATVALMCGDITFAAVEGE